MRNQGPYPPPGLTGQVLYRGDNGFQEAWHGYNSLHHGCAAPLAIVYAQDVTDVQNAVEWAAARREEDESFPVRVRCGGHDYQGWSSNPENGLIIDVSMMEAMKFQRAPGDRPTWADVGAGQEMQLLTERLWDVGVGLPLATSPDVGIAGLTLGGGFGPTSRKWGLTCDHLREVEMVVADGRKIVASPDDHADLFWACCGAGGGNFGVATRFRFEVRPVDKVVFFTALWRGFDRFEEIVERWQGWAPGTPDFNGTSLLRLRVKGRRRNGEEVPAGLLLVGQYTFDPDDGYSLSKVQKWLRRGILDGTNPDYVGLKFCDHVEAARNYFLHNPRKNQRRAVREHSVFERYKAASSFALDPLGPNGIRDLKNLITRDCPEQGFPLAQPPMIQLLSGGGQVALPPARGSAIGWRNAKFVLQFDGYWMREEDRQGMMGWVSRARQTMLAHSQGAYVGYLDDGLEIRHEETCGVPGKPPKGTGYLEEYFQGNQDEGGKTRAARLQEVKREYDPHDLFRFPQGIPL